jgi:hypothetical protein
MFFGNTEPVIEIIHSDKQDIGLQVFLAGTGSKNNEDKQYRNFSHKKMAVLIR